MPPPAVSICIPVYNGASYLEEALVSAIRQSFEDFEIVLVDDASSDGSSEIIKKLSSGESRIKSFRNEFNTGLVQNWNRCVELAKGTWIKFLFQDDRLHPDCVARMMERGADLPFVVCERSFLIEEGVPEETREIFESRVTRLRDVFPGQTALSPEAFTGGLARHLTVNFVGEPPSTLMHRDLFSRFGGFTPELTQFVDLELWVRMASQAGLAYIPDELVTFRVHPESTTSLQRRQREFSVTLLEYLTLYSLYLHEESHEPLRRRIRPRNLFRNQRDLFLLRSLSYLQKNPPAEDVAAFLETYEKHVRPYGRIPKGVDFLLGRLKEGRTSRIDTALLKSLKLVNYLERKAGPW